jgi:hypothetical protein
LSSLGNAQYPNGAWSHNYDAFPQSPPSAQDYPIKRAAFPERWSEKRTKDFSGCYTLNDRVTLNAIQTMLEAYEVYGRREYLEAALRGGDFLLLAQMPDPQPAWAQQYNRDMHPVWDRAFEPPAICGLESQDVLEMLLLLYQRTGKAKYLEPVPRALAYFGRSRLPDGKLVRFYELQTNRPLFFTEDYELAYEVKAMPSHYQFVVNSRLEAITLKYRLLARGGATVTLPEPTTDELWAEARPIIASLDVRGAWTEPGVVRDPEGRKVTPPAGIIRSETFARNIEILCQFLALEK